MSNKKRIALLIDPDDTWGRSVIQGIHGAVHNTLPWSLWIAPRDRQWRLRLPRNWQGDGIIAAVRDEKTADHVYALHLPTINVSSWHQERPEWYRVRTDDRQRAEMALTHFRERGFNHIAYYGPPSLRYSECRGDTFKQVVEGVGLPCHMFTSKGRLGDQHSVQQCTLRWLQHLPRPLAVFVADPHAGVLLTEACTTAGIRVPEEIAVLSGDTDELLCNISAPPLSSIVLASQQIGRKSVQVLDAVLRGKHQGISRNCLLSPLSIIERQSSEILAMDDPLLVDALRFIREKAHTGINVSDVLRVVPISRRSLEKRFHQLLGRTPANEIRRIKIDRIQQLLISTDKTIEEIAASTGFCGPGQLCYAFKKSIGQTPLEFRRRTREMPQAT